MNYLSSKGQFSINTSILKDVRVNFRENEWGVATEYNSGYFQDNLSDALASIINDIWQSLTSQEKEEIRGILK